MTELEEVREQLAAMEADRDKWKGLARKHEAGRAALRREIAEQEEFLSRLASHLLGALEDGSYVQFRRSRGNAEKE